MKLVTAWWVEQMILYLLYTKIRKRQKLTESTQKVVGVNKTNKIKINFLKKAETPRSLWQEVGWHIREKKEPSQQKGERHTHFSWTLQTERTFFNPAASKVALLFCQVPWALHGCACKQIEMKVLIISCRFCLLLTSQHTEASNIKTPPWI